MKKLFTFIVALMAVVAINAKQVVFDFTNPESMGITAPSTGAGTDLAEGQTITIDGVVMSHVKVASTATRIWNAGGTCELRIYTNSTITFTAEEDITAVEFEGQAVSFKEFSGKSWVGSDKSVTFTASQTNKISKATLTIGEAPIVWVPDTVTVSEAISLIDSSDIHDHYVKGVVMGIPFITYNDFGGKVSFWMSDVNAVNDTIEFYDGLGKNNEKWASLLEAQETLRVGDTILVYAGGLSLYAAKNFYEITGGYFVETLGKNPNPDPLPTPDTITVAQAVELATALEEEKSTPVEYVVAGYAVSVYDKNSDGSWSFYMHDEMDAKGDFMASSCNADQDVLKGDLMYVRGKITKHKSTSGNIILQIYKGTAVHAETAPIDTLTAAEALAHAQALPVDGKERVVVIAYVASIKTPYDTTYCNVTVWLNDDPASTYGDIQAYRAKASAEDGAALAEHDKVMIVGMLSHSTYQSGDETKHSYQIAQGAQLTIIEKAQGIEDIVLTEKPQKVMVDGVMYIVRDGKMYDVRGTQVR